MTPESRKPSLSRRRFVRSGALAGLGAAVWPVLDLHAQRGFPVRDSNFKADGPVVISSRNGLNAVRRAMELIQEGKDALDAVVGGVNLVEADPDDMTVGYGGLPNMSGVVELDASVMHGPTARYGAVGALQRIKHPSLVAKAVLERTDHCLLVGEGALDFARMHGFPEEDLLTDAARRVWVEWRETMSAQDDFLPPHRPEATGIGALVREIRRHYGTIHCSAIDLSGTVSGVTTTSGLAFKIPGRIGDSPIAGAGLYVDNEVGAAGSTGRGEANLENCSSFLIVERMRAGDTPEEACLAACRRIAEHTRLARLRDAAGRPDFNVSFYALRRDGRVGGAAIYGKEGRGFAVADAEGAHFVQMAYLWEDTLERW